MRKALRSLIVFGLAIGALVGVATLVAQDAKERDRLKRLTIERDELAAESLRSFRAHEKLQQVIPEYRPASKPLPGQRDA